MQDGFQNNNDNTVGSVNSGQGQPANGSWQPQPEPVKKKKTGVVIGAAIGVCVLIGAIVGAILMISGGGGNIAVKLSSTDYGDLYRALKQDSRKLMAVYIGDFACGDMEHRYGSSRSDVRETYAGYVNECLELAKTQDSLFTFISDLNAIKYDEELRNKYEALRKATAEMFEPYGEIEQESKLYNAWDEFKYISNTLSVSKATDEQIDGAVKPLLETNNETLVNYGKGWAELTKAWVHAEQAYQTSRDNDRRPLNEKVKEARAALQAWGKENAINIWEIAGRRFGGSEEKVSKAREIFSELIELSAEKYEENYDDSDDCYVFSDGKVSCSVNF